MKTWTHLDSTWVKMSHLRHFAVFSVWGYLLPVIMFIHFFIQTLSDLVVIYLPEPSTRRFPSLCGDICSDHLFKRCRQVKRRPRYPALSFQTLKANPFLWAPSSFTLLVQQQPCMLKSREEDDASCKLAGWFPSLGLNRGSCGSLPSPKHEASVTEGDSKRFSQCCYRQALPKCPVHGLFSSSSSSRSVNHRHEKHNKDTDVDLSSFQSFISLFISVLLD